MNHSGNIHVCVDNSLNLLDDMLGYLSVSVTRCEQFSEDRARGKLGTSKNRGYPRTNLQAFV